MSSQPKPHLQIPERHRALATAGYRKMLLLACFSLLTLTFGVTDGASVDRGLGKREQDLNAYFTDREQEGVNLPVQDKDELTARTEASLPMYHRILAPVLKSSEQVIQGAEMEKKAKVSDANPKTRGTGPELQVLREDDSKIPTKERSWKEKSKLEGTMLRTPAPLTQTEDKGMEETSRPFSDVATETEKPDRNSQGQNTADDGSFPQQQRNPGGKDANSREGSHQRRLLNFKPLRRRALRRNPGSTRTRRRRSSERMNENHETNSEQTHQAPNYDEDDDDVSDVDDRDSKTSQEAFVQGNLEMNSMHSPHEGEQRVGGSNVYTENLFAAALAIHKNTDMDEKKVWDDVMSRLHDPKPSVTEEDKDYHDRLSLDKSPTSDEESQSYEGSAQNPRNEAFGSPSATDNHNTDNNQFEKVQQVNSASYDEDEDEDEGEANLAHKAAVPEHFESKESYSDSPSSGSQSGNSDSYDHKSYTEVEGSGAAVPFSSADLTAKSLSLIQQPSDRELASKAVYNWAPERSETLATDSYPSSDIDDKEAVPNEEVDYAKEDMSIDANEKLADLASTDSSDERDYPDADDLVDRGNTYTENREKMDLDVNEHHTDGHNGYSASMPNTHQDSYVDDTSVNHANSLDRHTEAVQNEHNYLRSALNHERQAMASPGSSEEENDETMIEGENNAVFDKHNPVVDDVAKEHHPEDRHGLLKPEPQFDSNSQAHIDKQMYHNNGHLGNLAKSEDHAMASAYSKEHPYGNAMWSGEGEDATHQNWGSNSQYKLAEKTTDRYDDEDDEPDESFSENHDHETEAMWSSGNLQEQPSQIVDYAVLGHDSEPAEATAARGRQADFSADDSDEDEDDGMTSGDSFSASSDAALGSNEFPAYYENNHERVTSENEHGRNAVDEDHFTRGLLPRNDPPSVHTPQNYRRKESVHL